MGMGYGMGWKKFASITGMEKAEAKRLVDLYQSKNKPVLKMWDTLERLARVASKRDDRTLKLDLPSGRQITYFNVRSQKGLTAEVVRGGRRTYIWGGFLTENMTQAVARELFAAALLRVHDIEDCRVVWHIHDEIVCEVRADLAETKQKEVEAAMIQRPAWAADLPLAVESSIEKEYTK